MEVQKGYLIWSRSHREMLETGFIPMSVNSEAFAPHTRLYCLSHSETVCNMCNVYWFASQGPEDYLSQHKMEHFPEIVHFPSLAVLPDISPTESTAH